MHENNLQRVGIKCRLVAAGVAHSLNIGGILRLPQATHHLQLDHPQEVNDAVPEFLAKH